jgi:hypothetical protein
MLILASLAGSAGAAGFDEKAAAPQIQDVGTLRSQAQSFSARVNELQDAGTEQLIINRALAAERFDLIWRIQQAIDLHLPLGDLSATGFVSQGNGAYGIDFNAFPQWERVDRKIAVLLPTYNWEALVQYLMNRGFTADEAARLKAFLASRDVKAEASQKKLPVVLGFGKVVRKFDKAKRAVPDGLVLSYLYQRERVGAEATREWAASLLSSIGAHGARILLSAMSEGESSSVWSPDDRAAGIADVLASTRRPDFEQRATAQATGASP